MMVGRLEWLKWASQGQEIYAVNEINCLGMVLQSASIWKKQNKIKLVGAG
jgi:hypothetical protein